MSDHPELSSDEPQQIGPDQAGKHQSIPMDVLILTPDHEIRGLIYVPRSARKERRLSELLNTPDRRFLAVTDAQLTPRQGPATAQHYSFLQVRMESIIMLHPWAQRLWPSQSSANSATSKAAFGTNETAPLKKEQRKLSQFREKLSQS